MAASKLLDPKRAVTTVERQDIFPKSARKHLRQAALKEAAITAESLDTLLEIAKSHQLLESLRDQEYATIVESLDILRETARRPPHLKKLVDMVVRMVVHMVVHMEPQVDMDQPLAISVASLAISLETARSQRVLHQRLRETVISVGSQDISLEIVQRAKEVIP